MSSRVLITAISLSTERFWLKIRLRSSGEGCGGGTITAGMGFFRKETSGFDTCECEIFSFGFGPLILKTIKLVISAAQRMGFVFQTDLSFFN